MRRFLLVRDEDVSGMSGTGHVAQGVEFWDGKCAIHWMTEVRSTAIYESVEEVEFVHGHNGRTKVEWVDTPKRIAEVQAYRDALERIAREWQQGESMENAMRQIMVTLGEYDDGA